MTSKTVLKLTEHARALRHLDLGVTDTVNLENLGDELGRLTNLSSVIIKYCQDAGGVGRMVAKWKELGVFPERVGPCMSHPMCQNID
jgi:hypothetical protein